jgi:hypothetical protein
VTRAASVVAAVAAGALGALVAGALAGGCAWSAGEPFATLDAHIAAGIEVPADRDLGDGWQMLASNYQMTIDTLVIEAGAVALGDAGDGGGVFDPANPPPGYTLCHNGHCHAEDGSLVPYEDIAAGLGPGTVTTVARLPVGTLDVAAGAERALDCTPSCDLPLAHIVVAELDVLRVQASGRVRDGRMPPRLAGERAWTLDLAFPADAPLVLSSALDLPADRSHAPDVTLELALVLTSRIFDHVAWDELDAGPDTGLALADHTEARAALTEALEEVTLASALAR